MAPLLRLDIGCGMACTPGFTGVDLFVIGPGIVQAPMNALPWKDDEVDEIFSSHALEHVGKYEVQGVLTEWHRVLKIGGKLTIEVPDLAWCLINWLKQPDAGWNMDAIFGNQEHPGEYHKTGFTGEILMNHLFVSGWKGCPVKWQTTFSHGQQTLHFEIIKAATIVEETGPHVLS